MANAGAVTTDPATIPLTEAGRDQAYSIAKTITRKPDLIVISSYLRTQQTAEPSIGRFPDVPVETWPVQEFTYLSPGRCVGTTTAQRRPLVEAYWQRRAMMYDPTRMCGRPLRCKGETAGSDVRCDSGHVSGL